MDPPTTGTCPQESGLHLRQDSQANSCSKAAVKMFHYLLFCLETATLVRRSQSVSATHENSTVTQANDTAIKNMMCQLQGDSQSLHFTENNRTPIYVEEDIKTQVSI